MSRAIEIAEQYFHHSNLSDMAQIATLFDEHSTYYSDTLGFFVGRVAIIEMQQAFHGRYQSLYWQIDAIVEQKPNIVVVDFSFTGTELEGQNQSRTGREHILIANELIQHIAVGL